MIPATSDEAMNERTIQRPTAQRSDSPIYKKIGINIWSHTAHTRTSSLSDRVSMMVSRDLIADSRRQEQALPHDYWTNRPMFNVEGYKLQEGGAYCMEHAEDGMVNLHRPQTALLA